MANGASRPFHIGSSVVRFCLGHGGFHMKVKELLTNVMKQWLGRFGIHIPEDSVVDFFINTDNGDP